jgi:hypothetical protein
MLGALGEGNPARRGVNPHSAGTPEHEAHTKHATSLRHSEWEKNCCAPLKNGGGQNARATGGPGILPVTK